MQLLLPSQLEAEPEHGQAFATTLGMPDDASTIFPRPLVVRINDLSHGLVDGLELLVAGQLLFDRPAAGTIERDEVAAQIQEVGLVFNIPANRMSCTVGVRPVFSSNSNALPDTRSSTRRIAASSCTYSSIAGVGPLESHAQSCTV